MGRMYGSITNRFEEGKNYTGREIKVGDDITMYHWSDRTCYYVTDVINQKRIKVKPYYVCADKEKATGMGHQEWKYFKTMQEYDKYTGFTRDEEDYKDFDYERTWVFRYGRWTEEAVFTDKRFACNERQLESLKKNGYFKQYSGIQKISFGVRDYYHDWEF